MAATIDSAVNSVSVWGGTLMDATTAVWTKVAAFVPNLLAFIVILMLGYLVARLARSATRKLLQVVKLEAFSQRVGIRGVLDRANVGAEVGSIVSGITFWFLILTFLVSATEALGLKGVSATIDAFVLYLPKVFGAVFILLVGLFIAQFVRELVTSGAEGLGVEFAAPLGTAAYALLVIIVITLAVGQLDLETQILNQVISIVLVSIGAATALAFGLGSKSVAGNILAGTYVREMFREGDRVTIGEVSGFVEEVSAVKLEVRTDTGEIVSIANADVVDGTVIKHAG